MPRWLLQEDTIEDSATQTLHRLGCADIDRTHQLELHRAGALLTRDSAPKMCWTCNPEVEMRLAV